jgi:hypothetical protein
VRVKVDMVVVYGTEPECELQVGLFDALAGALE